MPQSTISHDREQDTARSTTNKIRKAWEVAKGLTSTIGSLTRVAGSAARLGFSVVRIGLSVTRKKVLVDNALVRRAKELMELRRAAKKQEGHFRYSKLPSPSAIRLLTIEPGKSSDVIHCCLRMVDLNSKPKYTALSYTWKKERSLFSEYLALFRASEQPQGGRAFDHIILCNGRIMSIHSALYDALLQLRKDRSDGEYWIDKICINQVEDGEKSLQVQMMDQIYANAELTLAWLGPVPSYLAPRFARMGAIFNNKSQNIDPLKWAPDTVQDEAIQESLSVTGFSLGATLHLIARNYFCRVWVLQELALAPKVIFRLGKHEFGPDALSDILDIINRPLEEIMVDDVVSEDLKAGKENSSAELAPIINLFAPHWIQQIKSLPVHRMNETSKSKAGQWSLQEWLQTCRSRGAQDKRDLVFAGLSLIRSDSLQIQSSLMLDDLSLPQTVGESRLMENRRGMGTKDPNTTPELLQPGTDDFMETESSPVYGDGERVKLWPALHANYSASEHEVLLNLAACILSGPDGMKLLSISSLLRDSSSWTPSHPPSWAPCIYPDPSLSMKLADGLGDGFSAASQLRNDPRFSRDGRILFLDGCPLGKVEQGFTPIGLDDPKDLHDVEKAIRVLGTLARMRFKTESGLTALTNASTYGISRHSPKSNQNLVQGLCIEIESLIQKSLSFIDQRISNACQPTTTRVARTLSGGKKSIWKVATNLRENLYSETPEGGKHILETAPKIRQELLSVYMDLRKSYPDAPWPGLETFGLGTGVTEELEKSQFQYIGCIGSLLVSRFVFITDTGYIGASSKPLRKGDEVMLVKGADIPYAFRRVEQVCETITERIHAIKEEKKTQTREERASSNQKIQQLKGAMAKRGGWALVGEAYVEGVMDGEAIEEYMDLFERLRIF